MIIKFLLGGLLLILGLLLLVFVFGPREKVKVAKIKQSFNFGDDIEAYLAKSEAAFTDIKAGQNKQILWADPVSKTKTEYSLVYIHGYTASLYETRPLTDLVAKQLGANIFYTRLAGHGRSGDALAEPYVRDWLSDTAEALEVARKIGDKVVVISASTGSTLVSWAMTELKMSERVVASVFISPNFGVVNPASALFTLPFAKTIVPMVAGERRSWTPSTEGEAMYWTSEYPSTALVTMGTAVKFANSLDFSDVTVPTYFNYSKLDEVVSVEDTDAVYDRWGGNKRRTYVEVSGDPQFHVNAGDVKSPETTQPLADDIVSWVQGLR